MRELKFRAWWKDTKRFLDGDEWYMTCSGAKHLHYAVYPYRGDEFVIEQYTGLKDKNGKEIYEGDIIMHDWGDDEEDMVKHTVLFNKACFEPFNTEVIDIDYIVVIGNIHENPELLKGAGE